MVKLSKFKITMTEPIKDGFTKVYPNIEFFDLDTAKQWAEKQREVWVKAFDAESVSTDKIEISPRQWTIKVEEMKEAVSNPEKKEDKNADKKAEKKAAKEQPKGKKARKAAEKEAALVAAVSKK